MRPFRFQREKGGATLAAKAVSVAGVLLILLLLWLSADPEAHERFHPDAGKHEDHHCVVTEFALGEAFYLAPVILVAPAATSFEEVHFEFVGVRPQPAAYVLLPSCGPPLSGLSA